jgi:hypothetical protein
MQWAEVKQQQTQLLARLTLSLFEQPVVAKPYVSAMIPAIQPAYTISPPYGYFPRAAANPPVQRPESERRILEQLEMPIVIDEKDQISLEHALKRLCNFDGTALFLDKHALQEADLLPDAMVKIPPANGIKLKAVLNTILDPLGLAYVVKNEMLMITTKKRAKGDMIMRIYFVGDIFGQASNNMALDQIIMQVIDPESWQTFGKGGEGVIQMHPSTQSLAIRQTEEAHAQIADLLHQIRQLTANVSPRPVR